MQNADLPVGTGGVIVMKGMFLLCEVIFLSVQQTACVFSPSWLPGSVLHHPVPGVRGQHVTSPAHPDHRPALLLLCDTFHSC